MTALSQAVTVALLHFVWQGLLVAFGLWVALVGLRRRSAAARYAASCIALALLVILPVATAALVFEAPAVPGGLAATARVAFTQGGHGFVPGTGSLDWLVLLRAWAVPVWSFGVLIFSVRALWGYLGVRDLRRRGYEADHRLVDLVAGLASRLGLVRPVKLLMTSATGSPSVIGWMRPIILLPTAALIGLTPEQLEAVLAHELAHIRRYDHLVNAIQILIETLLFYHPAVWWTSARIRHERELCCDDLAVRCCGDALRYARALTQLEKMRAWTPLTAVGSTSGSLLFRIQRLMGVRDNGPSKLPGVLAFSLGLICLALNVHWAKAQSEVGISGSGVDIIAEVADVEERISDARGVTVDLRGAGVLHRGSVAFPEGAMKNGVQGTVTVEVSLDVTGNVSDARVLSGPMELRKTVIGSVLQWHFTPAAAGTTRTVDITFQTPPAMAADHELAAQTALRQTEERRAERELAWHRETEQEMAALQQARRIEEVERRAVNQDEKAREEKMRAEAQITAQHEEMLNRLDQYRRRLEAVQQTYRGEYPDVVTLKRQVAELEAELAQAESQNQRDQARLGNVEFATRAAEVSANSKELERRLRNLKEQMAVRLQTNREEHPAILELRRTIEETEAKLAQNNMQARTLELQTFTALQRGYSYQRETGNRTLAEIEVIGLPDQSRKELLSVLPVHIGDTLGENSLDAIQKALHKFDEHLNYRLTVLDGNRVSLRIAVPEKRPFF